jgi:hypothetical protein
MPFCFGISMPISLKQECRQKEADLQDSGAGWEAGNMWLVWSLSALVGFSFLLSTIEQPPFGR